MSKLAQLAAAAATACGESRHCVSLTAEALVTENIRDFSRFRSTLACLSATDYGAGPAPTSAVRFWL